MSPQYYLLAQNASDLLILGVTGQNKCVRRKAGEVLADAKLLAGLSDEDKAVIETIARMGSAKRRRRSPHKKRKGHCI